jgi:hypothetical protein
VLLDEAGRRDLERIIRRSIIVTQWYIDGGDVGGEYPGIEQWRADDAAGVLFQPPLSPVEERFGHFYEPAAELELTTVMVAEETLVGEDLDCGICREDYVIGVEWSTLPCNHRFHTDCVTPWLTEHSEDGRCPYRCVPPPGGN